MLFGSSGMLAKHLEGKFNAFNVYIIRKERLKNTELSRQFKKFEKIERIQIKYME